jgi:phosphatidylglycerophosphate synthase
MARGATDLCVRRGIHPDAISYLSVVAAATAGACFWRAGRWPMLLLVAPGFCYLRLFMNMLDGMVALASGKASPRGEILNDLPDRASDILIFAGVAHSGLAHQAIAYWAIILALLTAYVGTLGQAVAGRREFGGIMSKPWRMVVLHIGAWIMITAILTGRRTAPIWKLTWLDDACLVIIAGCVQTICVRLRRTMQRLHAKSPAVDE